MFIKLRPVNDMKKRHKCKCKGTGKILGIFPVYCDEVPKKDRKPVIEIDCVCKQVKE